GTLPRIVDAGRTRRQLETSIRPEAENDNCVAAIESAEIGGYCAVSMSRISPVAALSCTTTARLCADGFLGSGLGCEMTSQISPCPVALKGRASASLSAPPINGREA